MDHKESDQHAEGVVFRGLAVSPGIVVAPAYCLDSITQPRSMEKLDAHDVQRELTRFSNACDQAAIELTELIERVSTEIGPEESRIFQTHLFMVRDRAFVAKVNSAITERQLRAEEALAETTAEYEQIFGAITDEYLRERIVDLRDVAARITSHLSEAVRIEHLNLSEPVVLVAREMFPSQTLHFGRLKIAGILTERGSRTSHAAIIARSLGLPAVSGLPDISHRIRTGETIVVDGRDGVVILNPGPEARSAYRKLEREFFHLKGQLFENRDQPALTKDGTPIELFANINNVSDATAAAEVGATGIGLFRTEYVFMTHPSIPTEEEQLDCYTQILEASPNRHLTIRTLDIGGDKTVPYFSAGREANPFMGWRSIRVSFSHPEFFQNQIRAILRCAVGEKIRLLLPMITTADEITRARELIDDAREHLRQNKIPFADKVEIGIMIEVPAAAICIDMFLSQIDFVSIGSNDLVQYLMAADRDNPRVAYLCDPLNPAVLRVLRHVIKACQRRNIPVTVCGEMAGRPRAIIALLSFGLRSFSMSPAFVPLAKELIRQVSLSELETLKHQVSDATSTAQVHQILSSTLVEIAPKLAPLDIGNG